VCVCVAAFICNNCYLTLSLKRRQTNKIKIHLFHHLFASWLLYVASQSRRTSLCCTACESHVYYLNVKITTLSNGYLGSRNDEERSEMRYVMRIAEFSESSNLWTQIALLGSPRSTPLSVSVQQPLSGVHSLVRVGWTMGRLSASALSLLKYIERASNTTPDSEQSDSRSLTVVAWVTWILASGSPFTCNSRSDAKV
jgi:hypothetical protein